MDPLPAALLGEDEEGAAAAAVAGAGAGAECCLSADGGAGVVDAALAARAL